MELLAGPCARVFKCFDQLGGPFVANAVEFVRVIDVFVCFCGGSNHEKGRAFEEDDLGGAAGLRKGRKMLRQDGGVGNQSVNYTRPGLVHINLKSHV